MRLDVLVDGLRAEDERGRCERAGAREANVQNGIRPPPGQRPSRGRRGLDRPDPAGKPVAPAELADRRGDEKDVHRRRTLAAGEHESRPNAMRSIRDPRE